jgi:poly-D-alanine transfer protein DltD
MENDFNRQETIPLYDRVKIGIYEHFQSLSRQNAIVRTAQNSSERKAALINYKERYCKFFEDVNTPDKLDKINCSLTQRYMQYYYINLNKINVESARKLTSHARILIENMGITKIENKKQSALKR